MSDVHVIVIGAGLAGLAIAQGLQKKGISYVIAERETSPRDRNWGITVSAPPSSAHVCAQGTLSYLAQASPLACSISLPEKETSCLLCFFIATCY
jgi:monoamine oxidase